MSVSAAASVGVLREMQMEANPFLDAFIAIDTDENEAIGMQDLGQYMRCHASKDSFAKRWLATFDLNRDGIITLEEFCQVLGLKVDTARAYRRQRLKEQQQKLMEQQKGEKSTQATTGSKHGQHHYNHLSIISASVDSRTRVLILQIVARADAELAAAAAAAAAAGTTAESDAPLADEVKRQLDQQLGRLWHVVIIRGQYAASYSHQAEASLFFQLGRRIFLVWRTPFV